MSSVQAKGTDVSVILFGHRTPRNGGLDGGPSQDTFDRTLLEGLEFGDPSFSWSTWSPLGSFATLGTF